MDIPFAKTLHLLQEGNVQAKWPIDNRVLA